MSFNGEFVGGESMLEIYNNDIYKFPPDSIELAVAKNF
jgi:hypothetical protein